MGAMVPSIEDPRVIRVLLRYREAVAAATERAARDLARLGIDELVEVLPQRLTPPPAVDSRPRR
jgi:hypothetical protein